MAIRPLSKKLQEKAQYELNENPEKTHEQIEFIKKYLKEEKVHLNSKIDDRWILNFLRGCKFDLEKTKRKLECFYTLKSTTPEFFMNRDPMLPEIQEILEQGIFLFLPNTENPETGPPLLMVRWDQVDYDKMSFKNLIKVAFMSLEIVMNENDNFVIVGQQILQDFNNFSMKFITQMTPNITRKCIMCLQSAYPTRIKGVHFINVPIYFRIIHNIVYPFLSKKLQKRIKIYRESGVESITEDIPLSILPKEYGGQGGPANKISSEWKKKVESYREWFLKDCSSGSTQSL